MFCPTQGSGLCSVLVFLDGHLDLQLVTLGFGHMLIGATTAFMSISRAIASMRIVHDSVSLEGAYGLS